jgi:hypothetical protein
MTVANAMVLVDQTAVPLALPSIMGEFGIDSQLAQWVLSASLLPLAGLLVLGGRVGDLLGRRRVFVWERSCSPARRRSPGCPHHRDAAGVPCPAGCGGGAHAADDDRHRQRLLLHHGPRTRSGSDGRRRRRGGCVRPRPRRGPDVGVRLAVGAAGQRAAGSHRRRRGSSCHPEGPATARPVPRRRAWGDAAVPGAGGSDRRPRPVAGLGLDITRRPRLADGERCGGGSVRRRRAPDGRPAHGVRPSAAPPQLPGGHDQPGPGGAWPRWDSVSSSRWCSS